MLYKQAAFIEAKQDISFKLYITVLYKTKILN